MSWELEAAASTENDADADGDSDSDGDEDTQQVQKPSAVANALGVSRAYKEFLQYLELGCSGAPIQEYPAVFVILSTIPTSVRIDFWLSVLPVVMTICGYPGYGIGRSPTANPVCLILGSRGWTGPQRT